MFKMRIDKYEWETSLIDASFSFLPAIYDLIGLQLNISSIRVYRLH